MRDVDRVDRVRALLPGSVRYKLAHIYLAEIFVCIIGVGSMVFGATLVSLPAVYARLTSFALAFSWLEPHWWGLIMVSLSVAMLCLLVHSRQAASIPTFLLGMVWVMWVIPIALVPGFAPSAEVAYWMISLLTVTTGFACMVPRSEPG